MFLVNRCKFKREVAVSTKIGEVPTSTYETVLNTNLRVCEGSGTLGTSASGIFTDLGLEVNRSYLIYGIKGIPEIKINDEVTIYDLNGEDIKATVRVIRNTRIRNKTKEIFVIRN